MTSRLRGIMGYRNGPNSTAHYLPGTFYTKKRKKKTYQVELVLQPLLGLAALLSEEGHRSIETRVERLAETSGSPQLNLGWVRTHEGGKLLCKETHQLLGLLLGK